MLRVEELRVRTIYDVVTGNIDVRDVTIPAFDETDGSYEIDESESDETVDEEVDE